MAGSAGAQPQPTVSQVQAKLKKLTYKENWLVQRYDQASQNLASARQRLSVVNTEVSKDTAAARSMQDQIAQIASNVYENGAMSSVAALLTSGNPQTLLSQSAFLTHLSTRPVPAAPAGHHDRAPARRRAPDGQAHRAGGGRAQEAARLPARGPEQDHRPAEVAAGQPDPAATAAALGGGGTTTGRGGYTGPDEHPGREGGGVRLNQLGCPYCLRWHRAVPAPGSTAPG